MEVSHMFSFVFAFVFAFVRRFLYSPHARRYEEHTHACEIFTTAFLPHLPISLSLTTYTPWYEEFIDLTLHLPGRRHLILELRRGEYIPGAGSIKLKLWHWRFTPVANYPDEIEF